MSTPTSPFNPSRQVERIREILVGRQMAHVEHRLDRLEHRVSAPPNGRQSAPPPPVTGSQPGHHGETGLVEESQQRELAISRLTERIQQSVEELRRGITSRPPATEVDERFGSLRGELRSDHAQLQRDLQQESRERVAAVQELASRISRLATEQADLRDSGDGAAVARLQTAVEDWQNRLNDHLQNRERWLISQLRQELDRLRNETWHWLGELNRLKADRGESGGPRLHLNPKP